MFKNFLKNKEDIIEHTNPDRIYVENVRSFFNIPFKWAKYLCEVAVRHKYFVKKYGVECKNSDCSRIIAVYNSVDEIPEFLTCSTCEMDLDKNFEFDKKNLNIIEFYQLIV